MLFGTHYNQNIFFRGTMDIGTGIFLSALFLGCIFLYIKSEHKAKWRKGLLLSLAGLVGFCVLWMLVVYLQDVLSEDVGSESATSLFPKSTAERPTDMMGIRLDETLANLQFERGKFWEFKEHELVTNKANFKEVALPNGITIEFPSDMSNENIKQVLRKQYFNERDDTKNIYITDNNVIIYEKDGRAERLAYDCPAKPTDPATYFHLIQCGNNANDVIKAYGQQDIAVFCSKTDVETRLYEIASRNIRLWLTKNTIQRIEFSTQPFPPLETFNKRC
jgi:hypothetical protein